jgi:hypothetical protein
MRWDETEAVFKLQPVIEAIEGYLHFERVIFVYKTYFRFRLLQLNKLAMSCRIGKAGTSFSTQL